MSNPFDQFAADFQAALPPNAPGAAPPAMAAPAYDPSQSFMAQSPARAEPKPPIMNVPTMPGMQQGGYGYGQPASYGMPPQQDPMMGGSVMGGSMTGGDFRSSMTSMGSIAQGSVYGQPPPFGGGYDAPPVPPAPPAFGGFDPTAMTAAPLPQQSNDPFGGGGAPPVDAGNPFGAPPSAPAPVPGAFDPNASATGSTFGYPGADPGYGQPPPPPQQQTAGAYPGSDAGGYGGGDAGGYGGGYPGADAGGYGQPAGFDQGPYGQPPPAPPADQGGYGMQPPSNAYGDPWGAPPPAPQQNPYGAPPAADSYADPWGGGADPNAGALVPAVQQSNPYAGYGAPPAQQNPYGAPPPPQQSQALTPYGGPPVADPFSVFEQSSQPPPQQAPQQPMYGAPPPQQQQQLVPATPAGASDNLWGDLGFDAPPSEAPAQKATANHQDRGEEKKTGDDSLPPGGEYYDARIFTPTLGVMFFKPQELTDSLFLNTDQSVVDGLGERPVVAFIVEGSSARAAGVELGHVLLKVNGVDVKNPKEASRLIKEGPRPLPLLFYVPNTDVVVAEGEHMVKYDTRETTAPNSAKDWKPKYVVIGGIIAQPWMMNMYRSKSEYDIAVIETQARRPVSVKVKQFSLQGARIQNDWQGPQMVKYKNKIHPWKYIVVLPVARNPIKISSPNLAQLKPVHEGIRRVLLAQNRDRGYNNGGGGGVARQSHGGGDPRYAHEGGDPRYAHEGGDPRHSHGGQQQYPEQQQQQQQYRY